jgi:hypothetical protein
MCVLSGEPTLNSGVGDGTWEDVGVFRLVDPKVAGAAHMGERLTDGVARRSHTS